MTNFEMAMNSRRMSDCTNKNESCIGFDDAPDDQEDAWAEFTEDSNDYSIEANPGGTDVTLGNQAQQKELVSISSSEPIQQLDEQPSEGLISSEGIEHSVNDCTPRSQRRAPERANSKILDDQSQRTVSPAERSAPRGVLVQSQRTVSPAERSVPRGVLAQSQRTVSPAERSVPRSVLAQSQRTVSPAERSVPRSVHAQSHRTVSPPDRSALRSVHAQSQRTVSAAERSAPRSVHAQSQKTVSPAKRSAPRSVHALSPREVVHAQ